MKASVTVENMQCAHCVSTINNALLKINGVYGVEANIAEQSIQIDHTEQVSLNEITSKLNELGYPQKERREDAFADKAEEWDLNPIRTYQAEKFFKQVAEVIPLKPAYKLMDFGCGTGLVGLQFAPYVNSLVMLDNSPGMLSVLEKKIAKLQLDKTKIEIVSNGLENLKEKDIDIIVSLMTFHHLENVETVIQQFSEKLNDGGYVAIADLVSEDGSFHDETVPHNGFDPQEICKLLSKTGFQLVLCEIFNRLNKPTSKGIKEFEQFLIIAKK